MFGRGHRRGDSWVSVPLRSRGFGSVQVVLDPTGRYVPARPCLSHSVGDSRTSRTSLHNSDVATRSRRIHMALLAAASAVVV